MIRTIKSKEQFDKLGLYKTKDKRCIENSDGEFEFVTGAFKKPFIDHATNRITIQSHVPFVKVFRQGPRNRAKRLSAILTDNLEFGRATRLIEDIDKDNRICFLDSHSGRMVAADKEMMVAHITDLCAKNARKFLSMLEKNNIVRKRKNSSGGYEYFLNPIYRMADSDVPAYVYELFKQEVDKTYEQYHIDDIETYIHMKIQYRHLYLDLPENYLPPKIEIEEPAPNLCTGSPSILPPDIGHYTREYGGCNDKGFSRNQFIAIDDENHNSIKDEFLAKFDNTDIYYGVYAREDRNDENSKRYSGIYLDLDKEGALESEEAFQDAVEQTNRTCAFLSDELNIPREMIEVFFSGNKGFHILVHPEILGIQPSASLDKDLKAIAQKINAEGAPDIDIAIYDRSRLFRIPNSINGKSGLYKVPVSHEMLNSGISLEEMKAWASQQREYNPVEPQLVQAAAQAYREMAETLKRKPKATKTKIQRIAPAANSSLLPCIQSMLDNGAEVGQRNTTTVALASGLLQSNRSYDEVVETLTKWNNDCNEEPLSEKELMDTINSAHQMFQDDKKYGCSSFKDLGFCSETCQLYQKIA